METVAPGNKYVINIIKQAGQVLSEGVGAGIATYLIHHDPDWIVGIGSEYAKTKIHLSNFFLYHYENKHIFSRNEWEACKTELKLLAL